VLQDCQSFLQGVHKEREGGVRLLLAENIQGQHRVHGAWKREGY